MAFWNRPRPAPDSLVAAASPADDLGAAARSDGAPMRWQDEAWEMYDTLGEFSQGVTWLGNVLSRARLIPAIAPENPGDEPTPIAPETNDPAVGLVEAIAHGIGGQAELLRSATVHLTVPGEGWFVGKVDDSVVRAFRDVDAGEVSWKFYSTDEIRQAKRPQYEGQIELRVSDSDWVALPEESLPIRVWRPHDRYHWMARSSTQAALPIMRRLELLNRRIDAELLSRLASNGMFFLASEATFPVKPKYEAAVAAGGDPFTLEMMDLWTTAIKTHGSAAAALPFIVRVKQEIIEKGILYEPFSGLVDPELIAKREFEIRRLATAIDIPPEVLLGMIGMNHWGAWQVEESALKTTVTSLLELVCWSLTTGYLRPALGALGEQAFAVPHDQDVEDIPPEADRIVWYDLSELAVRPDRSQDTITMHGAMVVTDNTLMRETGLSDDDLLVLNTPEGMTEATRRIGLKLATMSPGTVELGLELLGIEHESKVDLGNDAVAGVDGEEPAAGADDNALPPNDDEQAPPAAPSNGDRPARAEEPVPA